MPNFTIFTESKADVKFLKDYIEDTVSVQLPNNNFDTLLSRSGYKAGGILKTEIQQNFDEGKETILILDADTDFEQRRNEVLTDFEPYNLPFHLFFFRITSLLATSKPFWLK